MLLTVKGFKWNAKCETVVPGTEARFQLQVCTGNVLTIDH